MDFATFVALPDLDKLVISEHKVADEVEDHAWTATGAGSYYCSFTGGEVVAVEENGVVYVEKFSVAACDATASTFYYDLINQRLYIHTSGNDSPATIVDDAFKYCLMSFFWIGIANRNESANPVIYERLDELLNDGNFELWPSASDPSSKYWTVAEAGTSTAAKNSAVTYDSRSAYSLKITIDAGGDAATATQLISATRPNYTHTIRIQYKMNGAGDSAALRIYDSGSNVWLDSNGVWQTGATDITLPNSTTWVEYEQTFVTHASYSSYYFQIRSADPNAIIWFDYAEFLRHRYPLYYLPYLMSESVPAIYHGVGDYYDASDKLSFGTLAMINDGWWYTAKANYNWHNKDAIIKIGAVGSIYRDLETIFMGRSSIPKVSDQEASIDIRDVRQSDLVKIPITRFDTTTYPNLGENLEGTVIPILFGLKTNITPPCINTVTFTYKISQTIFGGVTYNLEAIDNVYKGGVVLVNNIDYVKDLTNGEFTLTFDPGTFLVTCDAKGLEIDFETATTYSYYGADIAFFVLTVLNPVQDTKIDVASLLDYKTGRTQKIGVWLNTETDSLEFLRGLRRSTIVQIYPLLDGTYVFKRYVAGSTSTTPRFYTEDYSTFNLEEETGTAFKYVVVQYDQDPTTNDWKTKSGSTLTAEYAHDIREALLIPTYLTDGTETENIRDFYLPLVGAPAKKLITTLPARALNLNPADNSIFSKTILDAEGNTVVVMDAEVYRILEFSPKNISTGQAAIVALEDLQSTGDVLCQNCFACQVCNTQEAGACGSCFTCQLCVSGQCAACQICVSCQNCDACQQSQCASCENCDLCQTCDSSEGCTSCITCQVCDTCETCDAGCQECVSCQYCYWLML